MRCRSSMRATIQGLKARLIDACESDIYRSRLQRSGFNHIYNLGLRPRLVWDGPSALKPMRLRKYRLQIGLDPRLG